MQPDFCPATRPEHSESSKIGSEFCAEARSGSPEVPEMESKYLEVP